jgi:hypothetical protein
MMGDLPDTSSNQLFSLHIEKIAVRSICMIIHIGNQLDYDVAVTIAYANNEPRDFLFVTGQRWLKAPTQREDIRRENRILIEQNLITIEDLKKSTVLSFPHK